MVEGLFAVLVHPGGSARFPHDLRALHLSVSDDDPAGDYRGPLHDLRRPSVRDYRRLFGGHLARTVADQLHFLWPQRREHPAHSLREVLMHISRYERECEHM